MSDEGSVMELEQRGSTVQSHETVNLKREEPRTVTKPFSISEREPWEAYNDFRLIYRWPTRWEMLEYWELRGH